MTLLSESSGHKPSEWQRLALAYARAQIDLVTLALEPTGGDDKEQAMGVLREEAQRLVGRSRELGRVLPMEGLARACDLDDVAQKMVWVSLTLTLDPELWMAVGGPLMAQGDKELNGLLLARLLGLSPLELSAWLEPNAPLRRHRIFVPRSARVREVQTPISAPFVLSNHVLAFLGGRRAWSAGLDAIATLIDPVLMVPLSSLAPFFQERLLPLLSAWWDKEARAPHMGAGGLALPKGVGVALRGTDGSGRIFALKALAAHAKRRVLLLDGGALVTKPRDEAAALLESAMVEAALFGELLVIRQAERVIDESRLGPHLRRGLERHASPMVLCLEVTTALPERTSQMLWLDELVEAPARPAVEWWLQNLPEAAIEMNGHQLESLSRLAALKPVQVRNAAHLGGLLSRRTVDTSEALAHYRVAVRAQAHRGHSTLLSRDAVRSTMDDLVLPPDTAAQIHAIIAAVSNRHRVLDDWRLRERLKKGLAITCLFDGEPGTGKTLSSEVIASELGLRLMRVNISTVVDKYIGETEKNLARIFEHARSDLHLLLFDEADSLFAKRTQKMERSTDRYSNMDINVLLQLIERFEGLAVLTTNLKSSIDPAFERRISFKVHFPMPGEEEREVLWRKLLPEEHLPTSEALDYTYLATLELSGGEIKNIVLKAAYRAAQENVPLDSDFLMETAVDEARAAGRLVRHAR